MYGSYVVRCTWTPSPLCFFFQAEDGIRDLVRSRGLGDVYKRQVLTVTGSNGCTSTDNAEVILDNEAPGATATGGTLTCTTTSIMLTGSGNGSFSWTGPNNFTNQDQNPTVSVAGTYVLTVTGSNGCTSTDNAEVILDNEAPGATATGGTVSYTHLRAHETVLDIVCRLLLAQKKQQHS